MRRSQRSFIINILKVRSKGLAFLEADPSCRCELDLFIS